MWRRKSAKRPKRGGKNLEEGEKRQQTCLHSISFHKCNTTHIHTKTEEEEEVDVHGTLTTQSSTTRSGMDGCSEKSKIESRFTRGGFEERKGIEEDGGKMKFLHKKKRDSWLSPLPAFVFRRLIC